MRTKVCLCAILCMVGTIGLQAQATGPRFLPPAIWSSERYANGTAEDQAAGQVVHWRTDGAFLQSPRWSINPLAAMRDRIVDDNSQQVTFVRSADAPNYSLNYEFVRYSGVGYFHTATDVTNSTLQQQHTTRIPSVFLVQAGHRSYGWPNVANSIVMDPCLQVFTIESRSHVVTEPNRTPDAAFFRQTNLEGLGEARAPVGNDEIANPAKVDILVERSEVSHPTLLRFSDPTINPANVRGYAHGDFDDDGRDDIALFVRTGTTSDLIILSNDEAPDNTPLDYVLTRHNVLNYATTVCDHEQLRHVVAADANGDGRDEIYALFDAGCDGTVPTVARFEQNGTIWSRTTLTILDRDGLSFHDDILSMAAVRTNLAGEEIIVFLAGDAAAVRTWTPPNTKSHTQITLGEMVFAGNDVTFAANVHEFTDPTLTSNFAVAGVIATDMDHNGLDEVAFFTQHRQWGIPTSLDLVHLRRIEEGYVQSVLLRVDATVIPRDNVYHTISGNIDYDVRNRTDVAILLRDPSTARHEDRLLVWRSMAPFTENDYAITRLENGVQTPFFPHGWWGIRLTSGEVDNGGQQLADVNFVDQWRLIESDWVGAAETDRISGIQYSPTQGRIPDHEIESYAQIYNTVVLDRHHHSDGYIFQETNDPTQDATSTQYYYNVNECVQGLAASTIIAAQHNLSIIPVVSHLEHDNYNLNGNGNNPRQFMPFDFQQSSLGAAFGNPLPNYFQTIFPVIAQSNSILGTYIADEPTNVIPLGAASVWGNDFNPQLQPALTPAELRQNSREFALTAMHRTPGKPVMLNFNFQHDFEFYRNAYDVSLFDFYMYKYDYETTNLVVNGIPDPNVVRTRTRTLTDNLTNAIIQHSFNAILRKQVDATIRCDKQAAMVIAQGRGDDYISRDVRWLGGQRFTLRTFSEYRNISIDEARYQMFVPAILGIRGSIFWEATSWIQGASNDPLFGEHEQNQNEWGEVIHHMTRNTEQSVAQRAAIDNASEEFSHYRNMFLQPSLNDELTVSTMLPGAELTWTSIVASVHRNPTDNSLWLFVGNMSMDEYGPNNPVTVTTGHSASTDATLFIPAEYWNGGNPVAWASTYTDGLRKITMQLAPYQVRVFRIGSDPDPGENIVDVMGHLDYSNQRKLVIFESPEVNVNGGHDDDPEHGVVRYHAVYHRAACETCPQEFNGSQVFYRRSEPMRKSDAGRLILWEEAEHCLSCIIDDPVQGASAQGTCAYPSIVVKYEETPGPPLPGGTTSRARVHVVYACNVNAWGPMEHPGTDHMGRILIVENIIDANAVQQQILPGQVYDRADGESIHTHGFPVIGAVEGGYLYAHSDRDFGIVGAYKPDQQLQYVGPQSVTAVSMLNHSDNHPAIWQYASAQSPNDLPVVWNAKLPTNNQDDNLAVLYAQLAHDGGNVAVFRLLADPQLPKVFAAGHAARISENLCGSHLLPSVLRMTTPSADIETDIIYWQNYRPVGCNEKDHEPENLYRVYGMTMLSGQNVVQPTIGTNLRLDGLHQIRHTQASVYDPNVTNGFRMIDDPNPFDRSMISVSVNPTRFPLFDRSQLRRGSELYWLREEPHRLYSSNVYLEHQVTNRTRTVTRHDDLGSVLQQSAKRGSSAYEDFLVNRGIYQTTPAITPEIVTSRRAYFAPKSETPNIEHRTLFEFIDGSSVSDIQSFAVDGHDVSLHLLSDVELSSIPILVNGRVSVSIRGRLSADTMFDVSLVSSSGKEYPVRCAPGEFVCTFNIVGTDSLRLKVRATEGTTAYHVTELGSRSPVDKRFQPFVVENLVDVHVLRRWQTTANDEATKGDRVTIDGLSIAPNPSSSRIRVVLNSSNADASDCESRVVTVQETATGRILELKHTWVDASTLEMNVQGLASGTYVITVTSGENITHGRFTVMF